MVTDLPFFLLGVENAFFIVQNNNDVVSVLFGINYDYFIYRKSSNFQPKNADISVPHFWFCYIYRREKNVMFFLWNECYKKLWFYIPHIYNLEVLGERLIKGRGVLFRWSHPYSIYHLPIDIKASNFSYKISDIC